MFAITLLIIHLFNLAGYAILFEYFIVQSDKQLVSQLDASQYNDNELIVVKIPLPMPYLSNWNEYERVNGEIEFNGVYYNYVKRKLCNDTLFLLCLPNKSKTQFYHARHEYAKQVNGTPSGENNDGSLIKKINITSEYNQPVSGYQFMLVAAPTKYHTSYPASRLINALVADTDRPPQANG